MNSGRLQKSWATKHVNSGKVEMPACWEAVCIHCQWSAWPKRQDTCFPWAEWQAMKYFNQKPCKAYWWSSHGRLAKLQKAIKACKCTPTLAMQGLLGKQPWQACQTWESYQSLQMQSYMCQPCQAWSKNRAIKAWNRVRPSFLILFPFSCHRLELQDWFLSFPKKHSIQCFSLNLCKPQKKKHKAAASKQLAAPTSCQWLQPSPSILPLSRTFYLER